jgi:hypothetical protein
MPKKQEAAWMDTITSTQSASTHLSHHSAVSHDARALSNALSRTTEGPLHSWRIVLFNFILFYIFIVFWGGGGDRCYEVMDDRKG